MTTSMRIKRHEAKSAEIQVAYGTISVPAVSVSGTATVPSYVVKGNAVVIRSQTITFNGVLVDSPKPVWLDSFAS